MVRIDKGSMSQANMNSTIHYVPTAKRCSKFPSIEDQWHSVLRGRMIDTFENTPVTAYQVFEEITSRSPFHFTYDTTVKDLRAMKKNGFLESARIEK
jgi:hypothetical protein